MNRLEEYNRTWKNLNKVYSAYAKKIGISEAKFLILYALYSQERTAQKELSASLAMPKQTVSAVLASLKNEGLIKIAFEENSKKSKVISLTAKGKTEISPLIRPVIEAEKSALDKIAQSDFAAMIETYDELKIELEQILKLSRTF